MRPLILATILLAATASATVPTTTMTEEEVTAILGTLQGTVPTEYAEAQPQSIVPSPVMWECIQIPDRTESPILWLHMDESDRIAIFDDNGAFIRREKIQFYGTDKNKGDLYGFDWIESNQNWNFRFYREDDETIQIEIYNARTSEPWAKLMCR